MKKLNQTGIAHLAAILVVVVIAVVGFAGWRVLGSKKTESNSSQTSPNQEKSTGVSKSEFVNWDFSGDKWQAEGKAPKCSEPIVLNSPVDVSLPTAVLYPGQTRGQYKPHGGFRFADKKNDVTVKAPTSGYLTLGSRYIEGGEVQILLFFVNPCGIAFRFDHLLTVSAEMQKQVDLLPAAKLDDSRTTRFDNPVLVSQGDVIATAVGFVKTGNAAVDFGVYDLRSQNEASKNSIYASEHAQDKEQAFYAVCWLDLLTGNEKTTIKALPGGDDKAGKTSDYCK